MCEHGDRIMVEVHVDASVAHEGVPVVKAMPIDACIADTVRRLDAMGVRMLSSCCGHGKAPPNLVLATPAIANQDEEGPPCPGPDTDAHASECVNPGPACLEEAEGAPCCLAPSEGHTLACRDRFSNQAKEAP